VTFNADLERVYLDQDGGRQILHVTFGSVLTHETFSAAVFDVLRANPQTHASFLARHLGRHLEALNEGLA